MISTRALARPTVAAATLSCLAALALAGCSNPTTATNERPASSTTSAAPVTEATEATETATTPTTPVETTTSAAPEPSEPATTNVSDVADPRRRLLTGSEVPGFNDEFSWKDGATRTSEPRALFGTCERFALTSIGATSVAHRSFRPVGPGPSTDEAGEVVAEFPDTTTARRAFAVLKSWRATCADRLKGGHKQVKVRALQEVPVDGGTAGWYLATYGPVAGDPDALYFDAQGMAVVGSRIAMVEMILAGQDYNYEPGQEPIVAALQRAATKLS